MDVRVSGQAASTAREPAPATGASPDALKIFISYSRRDMVAADAMVAALEGHGFAVTIDRRDLPYGEEWQKELAGFIAASDTVVWLVSPDSVKSKWVNWELGEVGRLSKRLLPIQIRKTAPEELPEALGKIHLLPAEETYDPPRHEEDLVKAIRRDGPWLRMHTVMADDASAWVSSDRDGAHLLRGRRLAEAEAWSTRKPTDAPDPTAATMELLLASRAAQRRGLRFTLGGSIAATAVALMLAAAAIWFGLRAEEQAAVAERQTDAARHNETVGLAALARVAVQEGAPLPGLKLALAAWPRSGDEDRPAQTRTLDSLAIALPQARERFRVDAKSPIVAAEYSPTGRYFVTASADNIVRLWSRNDNVPIHEFRGHTDLVMSVAFSRDETRIVTASNDQTVRIWDTDGGRLIKSDDKHRTAVSSAVFSPDGRSILSAGSSGILRLWNIDGGEDKFVVDLDESISMAVFSPKGDTIAVALLYSITFVDTKSGKPVSKMPAHREWIRSVSFSPDGSQILTSSWDREARLWDYETRSALVTYGGHSGAVWRADFSPDGSKVITASSDGTARIWDKMGAQELLTLSGHEGELVAAAISPDTGQAFTASFDGTARLWTISHGIITQSLPEIISVWPATYSDDGGKFVTNYHDNSIAVWDTRTFKLLRSISGHDDGVRSASFSPDSMMLITASRDKTVRIWDLASGGEISRYVGHENEVAQAVFSPNGMMAASASWDGTIRIWSNRTRSQLRKIELPGVRFWDVSFSPDGREIVAGSDDHVARVFEVDSGKERLVLKGHSSDVASAIFSPDGSSLLTSSWDRSVIIWNAANGEMRRRLMGHTGNVSSAWYSRDGTRIISAAQDYTARIWDTASGVQIGVILHDDKDVVVAILPPDWSRAITATQNQLREWDISALESGDAFQIACQRLGKNTSLKDVQERYGLGDLTPICGDNAPLPVDWSKLQ